MTSYSEQNFGYHKTFKGNKFYNVVIYKHIPMGGRVLKGSLKEALKGAKGASSLRATRKTSQEENFITLSRIIIIYRDSRVRMSPLTEIVSPR